MKIVGWDDLVDNGFSATDDYAVVQAHIREGIARITWPPGSDKFTIKPESGKKRGEGNGVKPIKAAFVTHLLQSGWVLERDRFDAHYTFGGGSSLPFAVEWETGNISSSHRSVNRIALAMMRNEISGGVVIVPSGALRPYLTDRIGNLPELEPYFPLWRLWNGFSEFGYLGIVTVEHDATSMDSCRIDKMTDGRALL